MGKKVVPIGAQKTTTKNIIDFNKMVEEKQLYGHLIEENSNAIARKLKLIADRIEKLKKNLNENDMDSETYYVQKLQLSQLEIEFTEGNIKIADNNKKMGMIDNEIAMYQQHIKKNAKKR